MTDAVCIFHIAIFAITAFPEVDYSTGGCNLYHSRYKKVCLFFALMVFVVLCNDQSPQSFCISGYMSCGNLHAGQTGTNGIKKN